MSDFDYLYKNDTMDVKDANGNILKDRDTVKLTKRLKTKGHFNHN
ncbi:MAG: PhnA domain-containing protein [Flavobacteriaceae bacterium]